MSTLMQREARAQRLDAIHHEGCPAEWDEADRIDDAIEQTAALQILPSVRWYEVLIEGIASDSGAQAACCELVALRERLRTPMCLDERREFEDRLYSALETLVDSLEDQARECARDEVVS